VLCRPLKRPYKELNSKPSAACFYSSSSLFYFLTDDSNNKGRRLASTASLADTQKVGRPHLVERERKAAAAAAAALALLLLGGGLIQQWRFALSSHLGSHTHGEEGENANVRLANGERTDCAHTDQNPSRSLSPIQTGRL